MNANLSTIMSAVIPYDNFLIKSKFGKTYILLYNGDKDHKKYRLLDRENITEILQSDIPNEKENWLSAIGFMLPGGIPTKSGKVQYQTSFPENMGYKDWDDIFDRFQTAQCEALYLEIERVLSDSELNKIVHIGKI